MSEMYEPEDYLTEDVLAQVMSEFEWGVPYTLEDDLDNITVTFPKCTVFFAKSFEGDVRLEFSTEDTKTEYGLSLFDALNVVRDEIENKNDFTEPELDNRYIPNSLEKVQVECRNICILLQKYMLPHIHGDFSWVEKYQQIRNI